MKKLFSYNLLSLIALDLFLLFSLDWIVWGEPIPPAGSLGFLECIGLFIVLSVVNLLLERIPEPLKLPCKVGFAEKK
jgi:hypothetical protein